MAGHSAAAVEQFQQVTGADTDTASFFLDSAHGDLETAVASFFEQGGAAGVEEEAQAAPPAQSDPVPAAQPVAQPAPRQQAHAGGAQ